MSTTTEPARYRKLCPRCWHDEKFSGLTVVQKLVFLYAITAQSNRIGLFRFSPAMAAEDLRLDAEEFRLSFMAVRDLFGWQWDEANRVLFLPTWWKYNAPEAANNFKGALRDLAELPRTPLLEDFLAASAHLFERFNVSPPEESRRGTTTPTPTGTTTPSEGVPQPVREGYPNPLATQEQEQEQEQESIPPSATRPPEVKTPRKNTAEPKKPTGAHAEAVAAFCDQWQAKYGETYSFDGGKDGKAVKWMLAESGGDVARFREIVARFLADGDKFYRDKRHTLGLLRAQFNQWKIAGPGPASARQFPGVSENDVDVVKTVRARYKLKDYDRERAELELRKINPNYTGAILDVA